MGVRIAGDNPPGHCGRFVCSSRRNWLGRPQKIAVTTDTACTSFNFLVFPAAAAADSLRCAEAAGDPRNLIRLFAILARRARRFIPAQIPCTSRPLSTILLELVLVPQPYIILLKLMLVPQPFLLSFSFCPITCFMPQPLLLSLYSNRDSCLKLPSPLCPRCNLSFSHRSSSIGTSLHPRPARLIICFFLDAATGLRNCSAVLPRRRRGVMFGQGS